MGNRKAIKIDRKVLEAKYRAAQLINIPHLKIAIWACRMRKIQRIVDLINQRKTTLEAMPIFPKELYNTVKIMGNRVFYCNDTLAAFMKKQVQPFSGVAENNTDKDNNP